MSRLTHGKWFRRFGLGAVAAAALTIGSGSLIPAQAHDYRHGPWWGHYEQHRHYGSRHHYDRYDARALHWFYGPVFRR